MNILKFYELTILAYKTAKGLENLSASQDAYIKYCEILSKLPIKIRTKIQYAFESNIKEKKFKSNVTLYNRYIKPVHEIKPKKLAKRLLLAKLKQQQKNKPKVYSSNYVFKRL